jgi:8-oxo-dGTP diphosphatase
MRKAVRAIIVRDGALLVMHRNKFGSEYYTLLGGGIDPGETAEQSLVREVMEESGFTVTAAKLVFVEEAGDPYGTQYVYYCEATGDTPQLAPNSEEADLMPYGNEHTPVWLPVEELPKVQFRSVTLQRALYESLHKGFHAQPVPLDSQHDHYKNSGV